MPPQQRQSTTRRQSSFKARSPITRNRQDSPETARALDDERRINICITCIHHIEQMLRSTPHEGPTYLNLARCVIAHIDTTDFITRTTRTTEKIRMISSLQCLALQNDQLDTSDIAAWCMRRWRAMIQADSRNVAALTGLGQAWLGRAQSSLSRIRSTRWRSTANSAPTSPEPPDTKSASDTLIIEVAAADRVEARAYLQPATQYLEQAVTAARKEELDLGDLPLILAEALISLSEVSDNGSKGVYLQRAMQYVSAVGSNSEHQTKAVMRSWLAPASMLQ